MEYGSHILSLPCSLALINLFLENLDKTYKFQNPYLSMIHFKEDIAVQAVVQSLRAETKVLSGHILQNFMLNLPYPMLSGSHVLTLFLVLST